MVQDTIEDGLVEARSNPVSAKLDVEALVRRLTEDLPASLQAVRADLEAHAGRALHDATRRLDLVSREEFDAQSRVLERSRELIDQLEARIAALEARQS